MGGLSGVSVTRKAQPESSLLRLRRARGLSSSALSCDEGVKVGPRDEDRDGKEEREGCSEQLLATDCASLCNCSQLGSSEACEPWEGENTSSWRQGEGVADAGGL